MTAYDSLKLYIEKSTNIVLVPHRDPDGDAISSCLGLQLVLSNIGKNVNIVATNGFAHFLDFLPSSEQIVTLDQEKVRAKSLIEQADLIIFMDFNDFSRIKPIYKIVKERENLLTVMIDHHPEPNAKVDVLISEVDACSTSQIVFTIIGYLGWEVSADVATCLLTGIISDTGYFQHNTKGHKAFRDTARLIRKGARMEEIKKHIYLSSSKRKFQLRQYLLHKKCFLIEKYNTAFITLTKEEKEKYAYEEGDTEGLVNIPLGMKKVENSILFGETDDEVRISFRSKSMAVNELAKKGFGGGGHKLAAGARFQGSLEGAVARMKKILSEWYAEQTSIS